jgi:KaiC/GvpD/RAD55 family RecA-like ATPase
MGPIASAQAPPQYLVLYAHSYGSSAILNALPQWTGQKAADLSKGLTFTLSPVLGESLEIQTSITFTLYLRASGAFFGNVAAQVTELSKEGTETVVPGARVDTQLRLTTMATPVTLGVGGLADYKFQEGSAIVLHINANQTSGTGPALLVWDDGGTPTGLKIQTVAPTSAVLHFEGQPSFGKVFQADSTGGQVVRIQAEVRDAIGVYRFLSRSFELTAPNGSNIDFAINAENNTDYSSQLSVTSRLSQGEWQVALLLRDLSGGSYSFTDHLWISPFYPLAVEVVGSDGTFLNNATLKVSLGTDANWNAMTNASGWGTLSLPSTQVVGPLDLTIGWLGTQTLFRIDVVNATLQQQLRLQLQVFDPTIRIIMGGLPLPVPVPLAGVTLYQKGAVQEVLTGVNGVARFKTIPAGNYTVRVDYFLVTYQFPLNVRTNDPTVLTVPFPHRTISLIGAIAILSLASVVLVRRRRGKLYPRSFGYFTQLTQGGLPETCFIMISGNSGSGKSVLLNSLAAEHLALGKSIYITNTEYPHKTRENMLRLGVTEEGNLRGDKLIFIDAYSAVGGGLSKEEFSVSSHTDLTNLSLNITKCLEVAGPGADVYFDSLNPLITALRIDYLVNFLQSVAAKVKANGGKFCVTVGTGIEKADLTKLEESSDCVIETELQESGSGQRRRLRIKKLRDRPYIDRWTRFQVQQGKGIVFLTRSKPAALSDA